MDSERNLLVSGPDGINSKTARAVNRAQKKQNKDSVRRTFLSRLPTGGQAIEIGVWRGAFSSVILDVVEPDHLTLIDPWAHIVEDSHTEAFSGRTEAKKMNRIHDEVRQKFRKQIAAGQVTIMREFSGTALKKFGKESIDFAYVDGDHSYEGITADLEALFPRMRVGGIMAFDDYHRQGWWGDAIIRGIHEFLGAHPTKTRVRALAGAQIAIEKF